MDRKSFRYQHCLESSVEDQGFPTGFDVKQTSQFLISKSSDDGLTWSEPVNLTHMCKKEEWWLWAPAPGSGITLEDGTLVFPTQGRDKTGEPFSNITFSRDGGITWKTSAPAYTNTTECAVVQLDDGSLMLNMRNNRNRNNEGPDNGRAISVTNDLGATWTEHPTSKNALIEPVCMASLYKHVYIRNGTRNQYCCSQILQQRKAVIILPLKQVLITAIPGRKNTTCCLMKAAGTVIPA